MTQKYIFNLFINYFFYYSYDYYTFIKISNNNNLIYIFALYD